MSEARRRSQSPAVENGKGDGRPLLELHDDNDPRGIKRKQPIPGKSFRVIGHMVLAMQRFKGETVVGTSQPSYSTKVFVCCSLAGLWLHTRLSSDWPRWSDPSRLPLPPIPYPLPIGTHLAASLNPTYTYGKRPSVNSPVQSVSRA